MAEHVRTSRTPEQGFWTAIRAPGQAAALGKALLTRYNSWEDFAAERAQAAGSPDSAGGWSDIRQHSAFHRDTIADRISPR